MTKSVLAIAAHPDDIEFVMAGTLLRLAQRGWSLHYFNIANGSYGSMTLPSSECARVRLEEAKNSAKLLGATFYPPICDDMNIFYTPELLHKTVAVVRWAKPSIILTHSPIDYMEDHQNACRLAVSAAFVRGMPNMPSDPNVEPYAHSVTVYHAQPHGNRTPLGEWVNPDMVVDITDHMERKTELLKCHASQESWLDDTQKMSSYVKTMWDLGEEMGRLTERFRYGEGWRKHLHLGFCDEQANPLQDELSPFEIAKG
jgi:LmbE family N-acetylglucosaminyl deacetylase